MSKIDKEQVCFGCPHRNAHGYCSNLRHCYEQDKRNDDYQEKETKQ